MQIFLLANADFLNFKINIFSWYNCTFYMQVDDRSIKVGGKQQIKTLDGYIIPLDIKSGLPYVKMRPYTDQEWELLPHVVLTGDGDWNPSVLDHDLIDDEQWFDAVSDFPDALDGSPFDAEGNYTECGYLPDVQLSGSGLLPDLHMVARDNTS
jgi:hypothetical protein